MNTKAPPSAIPAICAGANDVGSSILREQSVRTAALAAGRGRPQLAISCVIRDPNVVDSIGDGSNRPGTFQPGTTRTRSI